MRLFFTRTGKGRSRLQTPDEAWDQAALLLRTQFEARQLQCQQSRLIAGVEGIRKIQHLLTYVLEEDKILQTMIDVLVDEMKFDRAVVFLACWAGERRVWTPRFWKGYSEDLAERCVKMNLGIFDRIADEGEPRRFHEAEQIFPIDIFSDADVYRGRGRSLLVCPLKTKNGVVGLVLSEVWFPYPRLSREDLHTFKRIADLAAFSMENVSFTQQMKKNFDELRAAYNELDRYSKALIRVDVELRRVNEQLEEKVRARTKELVEANDRLRELDKAKSNFVSLVSHELRTPLTAIKGFVVTLLNYDKDIASDKRRQYLTILNQEADRLTRLIGDLLNISRIESGRVDIHWQEISVPRIVQKVMETVAIKAGGPPPASLASGGVRFKTDFAPDFPPIVADPDKLEQLLINLVGNALKYSPPDSTVTVAGTGTSDGIMIRVIDQGPGIPFDQLEKIFDKFYRLDNDMNRKTPGTGLGLSISKALVNLHGGKIWAESERGQGSQFIFTLPLNIDKLSADGMGTPKVSQARSEPIPLQGMM